MIITSTQNRIVVETTKLSQRKYRWQRKLFIAEGQKIIELAIQSKKMPCQIFFTEELLKTSESEALLSVFKNMKIDIIYVDKKVMTKMSQLETPTCFLGVFDMVEYSFDDCMKQNDNKKLNKLVLILDRLQDPGNLGTLIRIADSVGAFSVILLSPCVDPFDMKVVSASMGSIFSVPLIIRDDISECLNEIKKKFKIIGTDTVKGEIPWKTKIFEGSLAILLGNESRGLDQTLNEYIDDFVTLPMLGKSESLNVAIAGGVLSYEWLKYNWEISIKNEK